MITNGQNGTTSDIAESWGEPCWYRLPCGICRLTNAQCPKSGGQIEVTWNLTYATTNMEAEE